MPGAPRAVRGNGYHTNVDENTGEIRQQDSFIFSLVTFTFVLPLGIAVSVSHLITLDSQTKYVDRASVGFLKITYMIISIVIMVVLRFSACAETLYADIREEETGIQQWAEENRQGFWINLRSAPTLIGLVVFFSCGILIDLFYLIAKLSCVDTFRQCHLMGHYIATMAYHLVKTLFMGVLMNFSVFFKMKVMLQCYTTHFCLIFIMVAAVTLWFDIILNDAHTIFRSTEDSMRNTCNITNVSHLVSLGQIDLKCVNETTDMYQAAQNMSPFLYVLNTDFLLLSIEILIRLFFTMKSQDTIDEINHKGNENVGGNNGGLGGVAVRANPRIAGVDNPEADNHDNAEDRHDAPQSRQADPESDENTAQSVCANPIDRDTGSGDHQKSSLEDDSTCTLPNEIHGAVGESSSDKCHRNDSDQSSLEPGTEHPRGGHDDARAPLLGARQGNIQESASASWAANYGAIREDHPRNVPGAHGANDFLALMGRNPHTCTKGKTFAFWCLLAIIINFLFAVFAGLTYVNKQAHDIWNFIYQITRMMYWVLLLLGLIMAYCAMQGMASNFKKLNGLEFTLVVCNIGFALNVFFTLISAVSVIDGSLPAESLNNNGTIILWYDLYEYPESIITVLVIFDKLLNMLQVYFQSSLVLQAIRVKRRLDKESSHRNYWFCVAIMYLMISNFTLWGVGSLVEMKNMSLGLTQDFYLGKQAWHLIIHLTLPFVLFYRFNCGIIFFEILYGFGYFRLRITFPQR